MRYWKDQEIKSATTYKPCDDSNIDDKEQVRDRGIMMRNTATFTLHIRNTVKKARNKMWWVLRVFQSRKRSLMLTLLKSLFIPLLEYCCQLWNPWNAKDIKDIEAIQRTFTYKITEVQHLNYWERLHELTLSSETPWTLYNYIYLEDNTAYGAKYWWYNWAHNKIQKTSKTWNTVRYLASSTSSLIWGLK